MLKLLATLILVAMCAACGDNISPTAPSVTPTVNDSKPKPTGIIWGSDDGNTSKPDGIIWGS